MIELRQGDGGLLLPIRAHAGARRDAVGGVHDGRLRVSVTAAPERGKANKAIVSLVARTFGLRKRQVALLRGATSADKVLVLMELSRAQEEDVRRVVEGMSKE